MLAVLATSAWLAGCEPAMPAGGESVPTVEAAPLAGGAAEGAADAGRGDRGDRGDLGALARKAMAESRVHSPAGDSAIDHYLALRERNPEDTGVAAALAELSPYMVIATEQAIAQGDVYEADRLLALLLRMDGEVPALPRLRGNLQALHQARQAEMERVASESPRPAPAPPRRADSAEPAPAGPPLVVAAAPLPEVGPKSPGAQATSVAPAPSLQAQSRPQPPPVPRLIRDVAPRYPLSALRRGIEGRVQVAFTIEPDGSVSAPRLLSASPEGVFDEAALAAATRWRFEQGTAAVRTSRVLNFNLPGG